MPTLLWADNVSFRYSPADPLVVDGVSIRIGRGALVGILGPNGSGKTTLLRLLSGTRRPSSGRVLLGDSDFIHMSRRDIARRIAVVPQETELAFEYSALEIVLMGRHPHLGLFTVEGPADVQIAMEALAATGTAQFADRPFHTLSGGEKQRVVIAAALAQSPELLLLDEPTASLDLGYQLEVSALLQRLNRDHGVTMAISTHDLNLAASICQELIMMRGGRVLAAGPTTDVLTPDNVRLLYDVEADVHVHGETGHLTVVPVEEGVAVSIRRRMFVTISAFAALTVVVILWAPTVGSTSISLSRVFDRSIPWAENVDAQIFFVARLPRVLAASLVGATLAAAGVVLQAMLRNPLATPFTLGVSAGSALGAMLAVIFQLEVGVLGISSVPIMSFIGSLVAMGIVYALATSQKRGLSTNVLLLAGVTLNSFFSALILFVQYLADFTQSLRAVRWLMGDLDVGSYRPIIGAAPFIIGAFAVFAILPRTLNLLSMGDDVAAARGVEVVRAQRWAFLSASLATGAAVSLGGPVGFIGIIVPHLVRLLVGSDHRIVLPAATLFGAAFLVMCDLLARTIMAPLEIPVGIITALIGGPFFLWLLVKKS